MTESESPGVAELLARARAGLDRLSPTAAAAAQRAGAVLVDIRPRDLRAAEGEIPGALPVERTVLEWRFDPVGEWRRPEASADTHVVVVCSEGYSSSLAADALRQIGVVGGFRAWRAAGLPVVPGGSAALP